MKQLLDGKILQMLPVPSGVVVAIATDVTEDEKLVVEYRMISAETNEIQRVSKNVFLLVKFGPNHKMAELQVKNHLTAKTAILSNNKTLVIEDDGSSRLLSDDGIAEWVGSIKFKNEVPSAVAFDGKSVWTAYFKNNSLVRLNAASLREELRIGSKEKANNFAGPTDIFVADRHIYVSSVVSKQIWRINTETFASDEYLNAEVPIYGFVHFEHKDILWLSDGIYEI